MPKSFGEEKCNGATLKEFQRKGCLKNVNDLIWIDPKTVQIQTGAIGTKPTEPYCTPKAEPGCPKDPRLSNGTLGPQPVLAEATWRDVPGNQRSQIQLIDLSDCGIWESLGLRKCDALLSWDGKDIKSASMTHAISIATINRSGGSVEVLRGGRKVTIALPQ